MDYTEIVKNIIFAAIATVGLEEWLKNFIKTDKTWIYALIMMPLSVGSYCVCEYCPPAIIGSVITIGVVQICYQLIIQLLKKMIINKFDKTNTNTNTDIEVDNITVESNGVINADER